MDWNDLEKAWQSLPSEAAPAVEELKRQEKWRWLAAVNIGVEILTALGGAAVGVWMLWRGDTVSVSIGVATLMFVVAVSGASYWARSLAPVRADDPVTFALAAAVRRARLGVRLALAALWATVAAIVFLSVLAFVFASGPVAARPSALTAFGLALAWIAAWLGVTIFYFTRRSADLARLEALKASLVQEV